MTEREGEYGGSTMELAAGDRLDDVPCLYRPLLTPEVRAAFADPPAYFAEIAERSPFPNMAAWLRQLVDERRWALELVRGPGGDYETAWFDWKSSRVRGATVSLPDDERPARLPEALARYFSLVGMVSWGGFPAAGHLCSANGLYPWATERMDVHGDEVGDEFPFAFGWTGCGDMLISTRDGRTGGWLGLATHEFRRIGTLADAIDFAFAELRAGRGPLMDRF